MNVTSANSVASPSTLSSRVGSTASPLQAQAAGLSPSGIPGQPLVVSSHFSRAHSIEADDRSNGSGLATSWTSSRIDEDLVHEITTSSEQISGSFPQQRPAVGTGSALLRLRYRLIPWIDGVSTFGLEMMTLAGSSKVISDCVVYCMRSQDDYIGTPGVTSHNTNAHLRLLDRLSVEAPADANIGRALIAISGVFFIPPSGWASDLVPAVRCCAEKISRKGTSDLVTEPLKTLLRLHLKIGKAFPSPAERQCC